MGTKQAFKQLNKKVNLKALPKWKARVEIAKDVIAAINAQRLKPKHGTYVEIKAKDDKISAGDDVRSVVQKAESCEVCALGACLVAEVARNNRLKLGPFDVLYRRSDGRYRPVVLLSDKPAVARLQEYFSDEQIAMIELAFDDVWSTDAVPSQRTLDKCFRFYESWHGAPTDDHMLAIMHNIVKNRGTFKP